MASSVLGKRSRHSTTELPTRAERAKRRATTNDTRSTKESLITVLEDNVSPIEDYCMQVDELQVAPAVENIAIQQVDCKRLALSPRKINAHFKTTKFCAENDAENKPQNPLTPPSQRFYDALASKHTVSPVQYTAPASKPSTPKTPRTQPSRFGPGRNVYQEARRLFTRGANASVLVGRDTERKELDTFVSERVSSAQGGCIYVSGPPGTGKSAFVTDICKRVTANSSARYAYTNCMSVKNAADVYTDLLGMLDSEANIMADDPRKALLRVFTNPNESRSYVVVLDEIDQLLNLDIGILYSLFEMSFQRGSRMVLVGIANALDLTDRFLPRLKARNLKPTLLPFLPYTAPQIASVLSSRCRSLLSKDNKVDAAFTPLLLGPAITLISKKVASQTGDLRKAFDIAQRVIDVVEAETRDKFTKQAASQPTPQSSPIRMPLAENPNLSSPCSVASFTEKPTISANQMLAELNAENAPRATLAHVVRVTAAAFGNGTSQRLKGLNLQQKAILCSLFALEQKRREETLYPATPSKTGRGFATPTKHGNVAPTMRAVFEAYSSLCKRDNILHALSSTEFRDVVGNLETLSLINAVDGRHGSFSSPSTPSKKGRKAAFGGAMNADDRRISASVGFQELDTAVEGVGSGILKTILTSHQML